MTTAGGCLLIVQMARHIPHVERRILQRRIERQLRLRRRKRVPNIRLRRLGFHHNISRRTVQIVDRARDAIDIFDESQRVQHLQISNPVWRAHLDLHPVPMNGVHVQLHRVQHVDRRATIKRDDLRAEQFLVLRIRRSHEEAFFEPVEPQGHGRAEERVFAIIPHRGVASPRKTIIRIMARMMC